MEQNNVGREPATAWPITVGPYILRITSKSVIIKNNKFILNKYNQIRHSTQVYVSVYVGIF